MEGEEGPLPATSEMIDPRRPNILARLEINQRTQAYAILAAVAGSMIAGLIWAPFQLQSPRRKFVIAAHTAEAQSVRLHPEIAPPLPSHARVPRGLTS